ncbi:MAG: recombinase family protein [Candidatus Parvarchaeum sp.]
MDGKKIGYIRISSADQNEDRQVEMLKDKVDKMFIDKTSGRDTNRPQLQEMLKYIREGDIVYIESISRLARNTKDFLSLMDIFREKQVDLVCLKEPIDTTTPVGKFTMTVFAAMYEMELANIRERQKEGIAVARAKGIKFGRPVLRPKNFDRVYAKWVNKEITHSAAARELKISESTWYRRLREKMEKDNDK